MKQVLVNAMIITMDERRQIFNPGFIEIEEDRINRLGSMEDFQENDSIEVMDCKGKILIPGLINAHTHLGLSALRSLGEDMPDRLRSFLFPAEMQFMNKKLAQTASLFSALESLKAGVTCVADMYYHTDAVAEVLADLGIRALCGQTVMTENACDRLSESEAITEVERLAAKWKDHPLITPMIAPHGTHTVSQEALTRSCELARKHHIKMMVHVSEMDYEMDYFREKYQLTPIEYLDKIGVLGEHFISVHSIHAKDKDFEILSASKSKVVHCITANLKSAKGFMDLKSMKEAGLRVALGTDGPISGNTLDLFTQMRFVAMLHKTLTHDRAFLPAEEVLAMATRNSAEALGIERELGSLELGKRADIVVLNPDTFNMAPVYDPYAAIVYGAQPHNVEAVLVNGKWLIKEGKCITVDEEKVFRDMMKEIEPIAHHFAPGL